MNILLASSSSGSRGGGEIFLLYLAEALKLAGHQPQLWCATHPRMDELADRFAAFGPVARDDYANSYLDRPTRVFGAVSDHRTATRIAKRWQSIAPDVIHLNKQTIEDGLDLFAAAKKSSLPHIATIHITQSNRSLGATAAAARDWIARRELTKHAQTPITAVSDLRAADLQKFLSRPVETVYNAVPDHLPTDRSIARREIFSQHGWPEDTILAVCLARLVAQKNPNRFLRLAAKLHQHEPRTRFLWIGDGELKDEFLRSAAQIADGNAIACSGWISEPRSLLAAADIYLHPAAYEGLPLSILEAMSAALPCVLSPEIIAEARVFGPSNVIPCPESDDAWLQKAASETARKTLGAASRALYEQHFRPQSMADHFSEIYHRASVTTP